MDARTERLPLFTDAMAWFTDDDTDADTDLLTTTQLFPRREDTTRPALPIRPGKPSAGPPLDLMQRVLDGLQRKTWPNTPEGDEPDAPDD